MFNQLNKIFLIVILLGGFFSANAQGPWKQKKCAVVLTYDDALHVHLDHAIPALDSLGFKGTFYLSASMPGSEERLEDWKRAAKHGHELGNHTLFHPCIGSIPGREWVKPERDLSRYSIDRLLDEVKMTNIFLESLDGKKDHTFAYPCGDTIVQGQSIIPKIASDFVSARGVKEEAVPIDTKKIYHVGSFMINGQSSAYMINLVKEAMRTNTAVVFLFHGVGGEHALNVGLQEHRALLQFLKANEKDIWVAPFIVVTEYIKTRQVPPSQKQR